jgi:hypothetical protein
MPLTSDVVPPSRDEAIGESTVPPRRGGAWRILGTTCLLLIILGVGWIAGAKTQERGDLDRVASVASTWLGEAQAFLEGATRSLLPRLADRQEIAVLERPGSAQPATLAPGGGGDVERLSAKIDEVHASSSAAIEGLRGTLDRVISSIENNQRELLAKFENSTEQVSRPEGKEPGGTSAVLARLELLNERLERIERSVPIALAGAQTAPATSNVTPPPTLIPAPLRPSVPATTPPAPERPQVPVEPKKVTEWVVREVINGTAILKGPRGIIGVSIGDLVPGVGRVQSIARQGGRWTVATNKGVITAR